ncbi:MAG: hypothetical protein PHO02_02915 [Candidatus Nanoarchaeia archaeon]|nr:hypothetical protein [Candidatus Nanoarchaeia archaeon]
MEDIYEFARRVNGWIGHEYGVRHFTPEVSPNASFVERGKGIESTLYIYAPEKKEQKIVKKELEKWLEQTGECMVITTQEHCPGNWECYGHYVSPFAGNKEHTFVNKCPEDINGASVHFMKLEAYKARFGSDPRQLDIF